MAELWIAVAVLSILIVSIEIQIKSIWDALNQTLDVLIVEFRKNEGEGMKIENVEWGCCCVYETSDCQYRKTCREIMIENHPKLFKAVK